MVIFGICCIKNVNNNITILKQIQRKSKTARLSDKNNYIYDQNSILNPHYSVK